MQYIKADILKIKSDRKYLELFATSGSYSFCLKDEEKNPKYSLYFHRWYGSQHGYIR